MDRCVNEIAEHHRVNPLLLDRRCTDSRITPISKCIVHWNAYARYLGLNQQHISYIEANHLLTLPHSKSEEVLREWQKMCHAQPMKCTYRYLLEGCIEVENNRLLVGDICIIIADPSCKCNALHLHCSLLHILILVCCQSDDVVEQAGSDDVIPGISPNPHNKRADKPEADEPCPKRVKETGIISSI